MRIAPAAAIAFLPTVLQAQIPAEIGFEVASVRHAPPIADLNGRIEAPGLQGGPGTADPRRMAFHLWPPGALVVRAFDLRADEMTAPAWLTTERYDIEAVLPPDTTAVQARLMLRNLLRERFHLRAVSLTRRVTRSSRRIIREWWPELQTDR